MLPAHGNHAVQLAIQREMARGEGALRRRLIQEACRNSIMDAIPAIIGVIGEESRHQVRIFHGWQAMHDRYELTGKCRRCEQFWKHETAGSDFRAGDGWADEWLREKVIPWAVDIIGVRCWGEPDRQLMMEAATRAVWSAGRQGLPYIQVRALLLESQLECPESEVDTLIRRLRLDEDWQLVPGTPWRLPVLTLPEGHPMRHW